MEPRAIDFEAFAASRGAGGAFYSEPGLHNPMGFIPKAAQRRHLAMLAARSKAHQAARLAARAAYDAAVAAGEVRPLTSLERMRHAADGPDDSERAQAARRVLARRMSRAMLVN